jgi:hypothetical protein
MVGVSREEGVNMESSTIAALIGYFNTALIIVTAIFSVLGIFIIFCKKLRRNALLSAFCVAAVAAFVLEATVFNFPSYLRRFADAPTVIIGMSETDKNVILTTDGTRAELLEDGGIRFNNLNRRVTSVFVDLEFDKTETAEMLVRWTDETMAQQYAKTLYKYLPHENYAPLQPSGKVSELTVSFNGNVVINDIGINKPIPFYFSGLRLWVVSFLVFALFAFVNKGLRAKTAYYLFECKFDPKNRKQNVVYACTVALLILFSGACVYTSVRDLEGAKKGSQYGKYLVDALIAGKTSLDYGNPEKLLAAERPYDHHWREANGYTEAFDWAWYKGKYYCYFGVVPAALLYVPYKMITGRYLTDHAGVFLFGALAVILLALLWRHCAKKYMRGIQYALYLLSLPTLFFTSCITIALRFPYFYAIVQCAGYMFTVAGFLLLLKSLDNEKINRVMLFFACLCLALVFGCRPNMALASLLVPVILWKRRSWKLCAFAMLPYMLVAIPLSAYNYARFGSVFDFGTTYNLTYFDMAAYARQNVFSKIFRVFVCSMYYLFCPNRFYITFPFVNLTSSQPVEHISLGAMWFYNNVCGIINFPVVFCLSYLFNSFKNVSGKNKPDMFYVLSASLAIAAVIIVLNSAVAGVSARYGFDFATLIVFPSLFCAYYRCQDRRDGRDGLIDATAGCDVCGGVIASSLRSRLTMTYVLLVISIYVGLFVSVRTIFSYYNPTLYRYLEYSISVIRDI